MPRHAFRFPCQVRNAVRQHVDKAVRCVDQKRYKQEHAYCAALAQALEGNVYDGPLGKVSFHSTVISDRGRGSAEGWAGADLAITAHIADGKKSIEKAILVQAKRGALENLPPNEIDRLKGQIRDMSALTRSPKVMDIQSEGPGIYSARVILRGESPKRYTLADYIVRRVLTTLDGDTRPVFVNGVQDSDLTALRVEAQLKSAMVLKTSR